MGYKQYLRKDVTEGLDETYLNEHWEAGYPGRAYFDVHISIIDDQELAAPTFREFLGRGGLKVLESGCGTGRWMAYFEHLGNRSFGVDDSAGPLRVAREHDPQMNLTRANALATPFKADSFDAAFSSYVAEHFEDGPERLFREIHRVLKPGGLLFVVVPFNNLLRRLLVNPIVSTLGAIRKYRGGQLGFTEFRYSKRDMDGFLARTGFEVLRVEPDDYKPPWYKGMFCDLCDVGSFYLYAPTPPYQFGKLGTAVARLIRCFGLWRSCGGIFYVARARK